MTECKLCNERKENGTKYEVFMGFGSRNPDTDPHFVVVSEDGKERYEAKEVKINVFSSAELRTINNVPRGGIFVKGRISKVNADLIEIS